jgi:hypothetical protein
MRRHSSLTTRWPDPQPSTEWRSRNRVPKHALALAWSQFLGRLPWKVMTTLTFDPKRLFPVGENTASRETWRWCGEVGRALRRPIAWLYATERGRNGQWHSHVLLTDVTLDEVVRVAEGWRLRNGHVDVQPIWGQPGAVFYATKDVPYGSEIVFSDTIDRYRNRLVSEVVIRLTSLVDEPFCTPTMQRSTSASLDADGAASEPEIAVTLDRAEVLRVLEMPFSVFAEEGQPLEVRLPDEVSKETVWFVPDDRYVPELWRAEGILADRIWTARQLVECFGGVPWSRVSLADLISRPEFRGKVVRTRPRLA